MKTNSYNNIIYGATGPIINPNDQKVKNYQPKWQYLLIQIEVILGEVSNIFE